VPILRVHDRGASRQGASRLGVHSRHDLLAALDVQASGRIGEIVLDVHYQQAGMRVVAFGRIVWLPAGVESPRAVAHGWLCTRWRRIAQQPSRRSLPRVRPKRAVRGCNGAVTRRACTRARPTGPPAYDPLRRRSSFLREPQVEAPVTGRLPGDQAARLPLTGPLVLSGGPVGFAPTVDPRSNAARPAVSVVSL